MPCECKICEYSRLVENQLATLNEAQKAFFQDMYERLIHAEFECDMQEMSAKEWRSKYVFLRKISGYEVDGFHDDE